MQNRYKFIGFTMIYIAMMFLMIFSQQPQAQAAEPTFGTVPSEPPQLLSGNFECDDPLRLTPWTIHNIKGNPEVAYARERHTSGCDSESWVEHLEGRDALTIRSEDIETAPDPGKPFDIAFSQPITVIPGIDYSVSGWIVSFCGGTKSPSDCPDGTYIEKMVGLDGTGGSDPLSPNIVWAQNRQNFLEGDLAVRWVNLHTAVRAEEVTMTVFARINSPFQWHGNHAYLDAISVVRAPIARFGQLSTTVTGTITGTTTLLTWESEQSPDISSIPNGAYQLLVDVESRYGANGEWKPVVTGAVDTTSFEYRAKCSDATYDFRIRARSEQSPDVGPGVFPNHRYPGVWREPLSIKFVEPTTSITPTVPITGEFQVFLPVIARQVSCAD